MLAFFEWKSVWWLEQANQRVSLEPSVQSGVVAYAHKQSTLCLHMAVRYAAYWLLVMKKRRITPPWSSKYRIVSAHVGVDNSGSEDEDEEEQDDNRSDVDKVDINDILDFD